MNVALDRVEGATFEADGGGKRIKKGSALPHRIRFGRCRQTMLGGASCRAAGLKINESFPGAFTFPISFLAASGFAA